MTTVTRSIRFATKDRRKRAVVATSRDAGPLPPEPPAGSRGATDADEGRVPRVARLMALAIRFDQLLREGVVANQSELAKLARVTQPRMTQIMNLLHLAPDLQEEVLFASPAAGGREVMTEPGLRGIAALPRWAEQRARVAPMLRRAADHIASRSPEPMVHGTATPRLPQRGSLVARPRG